MDAKWRVVGVSLDANKGFMQQKEAGHSMTDRNDRLEGH